MKVVASTYESQAVKPAGSLTANRERFRRLLIEPANDTGTQFVRYLITGITALCADFGTLYLLTRFGGIHYLVSAAIAFSAGLAINYGVSAAWVFGHRAIRNRALEFGIFAAIGIVGLAFNELGIWLLSSVFGVYYLWSKILTAGLVFIWNFGARKITLFR